MNCIEYRIQKFLGFVSLLLTPHSNACDLWNYELGTDLTMEIVSKNV